MAKIKVLLIEDNRLLRDEITALLNEQKDIKAISSAGNRSALTKAKKLKPDVVLLDLGLKSNNSMEVLESIKKQNPLTEVVVMDLIPAHSEIVAFVKAGVSGYIAKDATIDEFLHTIRTVVKGVRILPPTLADSLFSQIVDYAIQEGTVDQVIDAVKFTKREADVISLLAQGNSISKAANKLKVAVHTVNNHVRNIQDKLALQIRLDVASFAHNKASS